MIAAVSDNTPRPWLTADEVAKILDRHPETVRRWAREEEQGKQVRLPPHYREGSGQGQFRFPVAGVNRYVDGLLPGMMADEGMNSGPIRGRRAGKVPRGRLRRRRTTRRVAHRPAKVKGARHGSGQ